MKTKDPAGRRGRDKSTTADTLPAAPAAVNTTLPQTFTHDGFAFQRLQRSGDVALFEKRKPAHSRATFEVVIVQNHPAETICGRQYPARESMPPSEAWGTAGWTHMRLDDANHGFHALTKARQEPPFQPAATPAKAPEQPGAPPHMTREAEPPTRGAATEQIPPQICDHRRAMAQAKIP